MIFSMAILHDNYFSSINAQILKSISYSLEDCMKVDKKRRINEEYKMKDVCKIVSPTQSV